MMQKTVEDASAERIPTRYGKRTLIGTCPNLVAPFSAAAIHLVSEVSQSVLEFPARGGAECRRRRSEQVGDQTTSYYSGWDVCGPHVERQWISRQGLQGQRDASDSTTRFRNSKFANERAPRISFVSLTP